MTNRRRAVYDASMIVEDPGQLLRTLREAHRQLDLEIAGLQASQNADQLEIARLKKRKLQLRDEIVRAAADAIPDLIA